MDTLRGPFDMEENFSDHDPVEDEEANATPPPGIGQDERRMQVRAYNFWAGLLADRNFPAIEDLEPAILSDFGPYGVLLDFTEGAENPRIGHLGAELAAECDAKGMTIDRLSNVPSRSLLSRITDHYMQILANQAPIGFEAEFVNQRGMTILYRGILLPFSSDDDTIDFIYGVINWKELADAEAADELLLEIDQALEATPPLAPGRQTEEMTDWADGPGAPANAPAEDDPLPRPTFGMTGQPPQPPAPAEPPMAEMPAEPAPLPAAPEPDEEEEVQADAGQPAEDLPAETLDPAGMGLGDWLAAARETAREAGEHEDRSRAALYRAIGRAWDFALAAKQEPEEFAELVADAGLKMQERAPMTPVVKLVFGADYDKTRLTEYACALSHAERVGLGQGRLADFLDRTEGGLKGVVKEERALRREEAGKPARPARRGPSKKVAGKLRSLEPRRFETLAPEGEEFALVMIRRTDGEVVMLGEVPEDSGLVEKAAKQLID